MARKKKRRAKKSNPAAKRKTHRRKKRRANPANPKRRRSSHRRKHTAHRRRARSNPRRARRAHARSRRNPTRRRTSHRRHRRNPEEGKTSLTSVLIALGLGGLAFVVTDVATFYATADMAKDGPRNRKILALLGAAGGVYLAIKKRPLIGLGLAIGSLLAGFGNALDLQVLQMLPAKASGAKPLNGLGAVAYDNMRGMGEMAYESAPRMLGMGAVAYDNMRGMGEAEYLGAVAYDNMRGTEYLGDIETPPPPWENENPFS